jgi:hypothetical protein
VLGIDTFGANVFVASRADQTLVEEHDERGSGQQVLYVILQGEALFTWTARRLGSNAAQPSPSPILPSDATPRH